MTHLIGAHKRFFNLWRDVLVEFMTLVEILPEGQLYYYKSPRASMAVWVVVGPYLLLIAYPWGESPQAIRDRVRLWREDLQAGRAPTLFPEDPHDPVYAAKEDADTGDLFVASFHRGDSCGLASPHNWPLPPARNQLPTGWPESYRGRIAELAKDKTDSGESHPG